MESRSLIWGKDFGLGGMELDASQKNEIILELTNSFVQNQEYDICIASNWNLNQGSGSEILSYFLKMSNNSYDFRMILEKVNSSALKGMFCIDAAFKLNAPRQSSVYLANLRQVCEQMKYDLFHKDLLEFIVQESLSSLIDQDSVGSIHTDLEIKHFQWVYQETIEREDDCVELIELPEQEADAEPTQNFTLELSVETVSCQAEELSLKTPIMKRKSMVSIETRCSDMSQQFSPDSLMIDSSLLRGCFDEGKFELNKHSKTI